MILRQKTGGCAKHDKYKSLSALVKDYLHINTKLLNLISSAVLDYLLSKSAGILFLFI